MRGVVSGGDGNHTGSQPSTGTYLDEQPVTTIDGSLDVHVYDIQRVEVLAGPQGTLYGASSEAGTIRIITNKPDPGKFAAGYNLGVNSVAHGGIGYLAEGFVNLPLSPVAAIRLVGWDQHDAGFIDNVAGTNASAGIVKGIRTFNTWSGQTTPVSGAGAPYQIPTNGVVGAGAISNAGYVKKAYNKVDTKGARAALNLDLGDHWTVTPAIMGQRTDADGFFGYDPGVGDLKVAHFGPETSHDSFVQTALTVEGKISDFDIVFAGAYMKRSSHTVADYSDYSFFYDNLFGSGTYWVGNDGKPVMPQELVLANNQFIKWSNEIRVSTPQNRPVKATFGAFIQRQLHEIEQIYVMPGYNGNGLADYYSIPRLKNTIWLTEEERVDRDRAVFGQVTWDITEQLAITGGLRYYKTDNSVQGFYGYSTHYASLGQRLCGPPGGPPDPNYRPFRNGPCTNLDKEVTELGHIPRVNLTYKLTPDKMVYATYSKGFRPGGVNRAKDPNTGNFVPPYQADFLTNYEIGWKTQWLGHHVRWNGALFEEDWKNFQFSFLVPPSLTAIANGGQAKIKGVETDVQWSVGNGLLLTASATLLKPELTSDYCGAFDASGKAVSSNPCPANAKHATPYPPLAPSGSTLPVTPKFKANAVARYSFELSGWDANVQGALVHQGSSTATLRRLQSGLLGVQEAFTLFDVSGGIERNGMSWDLAITNLFDKRADLTRFAQCDAAVCLQKYIIPSQPRTIGLRFGQKF